MASTSTEATQEEIDMCGTQLLQLVRDKSEGITNDDIKEHLGHFSVEVRLKSVNNLVATNMIDILQKGKNTLLYRFKDPAKTTSSTIEMENDERIIYNIIEAGGNTGIWIKDIRTKSNLVQTQLNKILKNLENRKLIKAVKSVNASKKKVYMLFDVDPATSVTGGAWYHQSDFEAEFVDILNQQCLKFLQQKRIEAKKCREGPHMIQIKSLCRVSEVHEYITKLGISNVALAEDDLETILKTIVYDGKAVSVPQIDGTNLYKSVDSLLPPKGLVQIPCGICPLIQNCSDVGSITPKTCAYMSEWLE
jgi:DNA-directed RNA polymerase III subunit RPC6